MALRERVYVEVGENLVVLVDLEGRNLAFRDRAKDTVVFHASIIPKRRPGRRRPNFLPFPIPRRGKGIGRLWQFRNGQWLFP